MKRCNKCVMTDTRPGIKFNNEGTCYPCLSFEERKKMDWNDRWKQLEELCNKHRRNNEDYDCIITVSGGKDSHFQVGLFKEKFNMNPLGVMIDNTSWTQTGRENYYNLSDRFGIDIINVTINRKKMRELTIRGFEENLHPMKYWDECLYEKPLQLAQKLGIKLVVWGENVNIYIGGGRTEDVPSALLLVNNPEKYKELDIIFTSYYVPWSRFANAKYAKANGFKGLSDTMEWKREGFIDMFEFEQVDSIGYSVNQYAKFIKFGFGYMTELCSDAIRHGLMSRKEALEIIRDEDWKLDSWMLSDFLEGLNMSEKHFWEVINKFANRDILEKRDGWWRVKNE